MNNFPKILLPNNEVINSGWNKYLPVPLEKGEKCILDSDQSDVGEDYIRIKHNKANSKSIFHIRNFTDIKGKSIQ